MLQLGNAQAPVTIWGADISPGLVQPGQEEHASWEPVALDHAWRRSGWCGVPVSTYRIDFNLESAPRDGLGLYIRRAGNRLRVWVNGEESATFGDLKNPNADYSNLPLFAPLAWHALRMGTNTVLIQVAGDCRRFSGLSHLDIGPMDVVAAIQASERRKRSYPTVGVVAVCGLFAVLGLTFFFLSRQRMALYFGLSNGLWAVRTAMLGPVEFSLPYEVWFTLLDVTYAGWLALLSILCMRLTSMNKPWLEKLQWVSLVVLAIASGLTAMGLGAGFKLVGLQFTMASGAWVMLVMMWSALREPRESSVALSLATFPMFVMALWDHWNVWWSPARDAYQRYYYSPLLVVFMLVAVALLMMRQYQLAMRSDDQYRQSLEVEVERQRQLLHEQHARELEHAQGVAVQVERQRIVRDMHDGLGAQLAGMLATVRAEQATPQVLESDLSDAIDQLRFAIDNLSPSDTDLPMMLAQFRFHNEQRLKRLGIRLVWVVEPMPMLPWPARAVWEMQQMLREVLVNALKHGKPQTLRIEAHCTKEFCTIAMEDDGCGFDAASVKNGRGLSHLRQRSAELGLELSMHSSKSARGTRVRWKWPSAHIPFP